MAHGQGSSGGSARIGVRRSGRAGAREEIAERRLETPGEHGVGLSDLVNEAVDHDAEGADQLVRPEACDQRVAQRIGHRVGELIHPATLGGRHTVAPARRGEDRVTCCADHVLGLPQLSAGQRRSDVERIEPRPADQLLRRRGRGRTLRRGPEQQLEGGRLRREVPLRRECEVDLQAVREHEHAVQPRARPHVHVMDGAVLLVHASGPVVEGRRDLRVLVEAERKVDVRPAILASHRGRAGEGRRRDPWIRPRRGDELTTHALALLRCVHGSSPPRRHASSYPSRVTEAAGPRAVSWSELRFASPLVKVMTVTCDLRRSGPSLTYYVDRTWVGLPLSGLFTVHARDDEHLVHQALGVVFPQGLEYRMGHPTDDGDTAVTLGFDTGIVEEALSTTLERVRVTRLDVRLRYTLGLLLAAARRGDDALLVDVLALDLLRSITAGLAPERQCSTSPAARAKVDRVRALPAERPEDHWTLQSVARLVDYSPFHLARQFRVHTGVSVHRYLTDLRVAAVLGRIEAGDPYGATIAADLGFSHHSHLTATLRGRLGLTPRAIRERLGRPRRDH